MFVSEVEFHNTISVVQGNDVLKILTLNSFDFIEKVFKVWHYYGIVLVCSIHSLPNGLSSAI